MNPLRLARASLLAGTTLALVVGGASVASADSAVLDGTSSSHASNGSIGAPVTSAQSSARSAARAAAAPINITKVNVGSFAVRKKVTSRPVVFKYKQTGSFSSISIKANLYRGSKFIKKINFGSRTGAYFTFGRSYGRGGFRVDNFTISWTNASGKHTARDTTGGTFKAKSAIRGGLRHEKVIHMTHRGSKVSAKFRVMRYTTSGWRPYSGAKVHFQITKSNHWKTRKTLRLNSKGVGTDHFVANRKHRYRITVPTTAYTVGGRSKTLKL